MKKLLIFLIVFLPALAFGQTLYTAGITFCSGAPSHNPGATGAKFAVDTSTWELYVRSYGTSWAKVGDWLQNISGCSAPAYTPTKFQSVFVVNNCTPPELYYYTGSAWEQLGGGSASTLDVFDPGLGGEMWATVSGGGDTLKIVGGTNIDVSPGAPGEVVITNVAPASSTNLSFSGTSSPVTLNSSTGTDVQFRDSTGIAITAIPGKLTIRNTQVGLTDGDKGDIDVSSSGTVWDIDTSTVGPIELQSTAVSPGSYTNTSLTVDADGRITAASSGSAGVTGSGLANRLAYWTASGVMGFESTLRVDSTNNRLMIGSQEAPAAELHVKRASSTSAPIASFERFNNTTPMWVRFGAAIATSSGPAVEIGISGGSNQFFTGTAQDDGVIKFINAGTKKLFIGSTTSQTAGIIMTADPFVGIGVSTPTTRLNIRGSGQTSGTSVLDVENSVDSTILFVRNDRRVGMNTTTPDVSLDCGDNTDGVKLPASTTANRPSVNNVVRVNTDSTKAEIRLNGTWEIINSGLRSNKALDFPSTAASSFSDLTLTVTGASIGDVCSVGVPAAGQVNNVVYNCWVSASNTVTVRLLNNDAASAIDPGSGTFKVFVTK